MLTLTNTVRFFERGKHRPMGSLEYCIRLCNGAGPARLTLLEGMVGRILRWMLATLVVVHRAIDPRSVDPRKMQL